MDVGGVQSGFAAVLARPGGVRADQPHPGPVGVVVNLPRRGEERVDILLREEIGAPWGP